LPFVALPRTAAQQINGREGETATLLKTVSLFPHVACIRFRPAPSQPLGVSWLLNNLVIMEHGKIILISGTSSSGKSTLAKGLQKSLADPFLHLQLDSYIEMLPRTDDWEMFRRMVRGLNRSVAVMTEEGNNLIVEHVLIDNAWLEQLLELLRERYVLFVGLDCQLDELERREKERDARRQGFARQQFDNIHTDKIYDLKLDTSVLSAEECVGRVLDFYNGNEPRAFEKMRSKD
jgi:chloramphenicol 3-O phosphotransferase